MTAARTLWVVGLVWVGLLAGCSRKAGSASEPELPPGIGPTAVSSAPPTAVREAVIGGNQFGVDVYHHLSAARAEGNMALSPVGLANQLALVSTGARGKTQEELVVALRLPAGAGSADRYAAALEAAERPARPPYRLGLRVADAAAAGGGATVEEVYPNTPAARVGIARGDVVLQVDEEPVSGPAGFATALDRPGPDVALVVRDARRNTQTFKVKLQVAPPAAPQAAGLTPRLTTATAVWHHPGGAIKPEFRKEAEGRFRGEVRELEADPKAAAHRVNKWVADRTNGLLTGGLTPADVPDPKAILSTGAVCFQAGWADVFDKKRTAPAPFTVGPQKVVQVPFMRLESDFATGAGDKYQLIDLPYRGGTHSMIILLPDAGVPLGVAEAVLAKPDFGVPDRATREVALTLPQFDITSDAKLKESLAAFGVKTGFAPGADFSGLTDGPTHLADVGHRVRVRVDEDGTVAAAATIVHVVASGGKTPPAFTVDRPFVFVIRDNRTGLILFVGRVTDPSAA